MPRSRCVAAALVAASVGGCSLDDGTTTNTNTQESNDWLSAISDGAELHYVVSSSTCSVEACTQEFDGALNGVGHYTRKCSQSSTKAFREIVLTKSGQTALAAVTATTAIAHVPIDDRGDFNSDVREPYRTLSVGGRVASNAASLVWNEELFERDKNSGIPEELVTLQKTSCTLTGAFGGPGVDATGAVVSPAIRSCWERASNGQALDRLGPPVSDRGGPPFAVRWGAGLAQNFDAGIGPQALGVSSCLQADGSASAWLVTGGIRDAYLALGGSSSYLGYPIEDADASGAQRFQGGTIVFDPGSNGYRAAPSGGDVAPGVDSAGATNAEILDCYNAHGGAGSLGAPFDDGHGSAVYGLASPAKNGWIKAQDFKSSAGVSTCATGLARQGDTWVPIASLVWGTVRNVFLRNSSVVDFPSGDTYVRPGSREAPEAQCGRFNAGEVCCVSGHGCTFDVGSAYYFYDDGGNKTGYAPK